LQSVPHKRAGQNTKMTAEIAVMNKSAVALAADSAVTIEHQGGQKIYNTVNKLFALSRTCPVGIMIYGSAEITGVPWETIIRIYQDHLGQRRFDRLEDYAKHFISFLDRKNPIFPQAQQDLNFKWVIKTYFRSIREEIEKSVKKEIEQTGKCENAKVRRFCDKHVGMEFKMWQRAKRLKHLPQNHARKILAKYRATITKIVSDVFEELPLSRTALSKLKTIPGDLFSKELFPMNCSGVVIAGFGEKETFPSVQSCEAESVINNRLKYRTTPKSSRINFKNTASVIPFAQDDVVFTFVEGTDPRYQTLVVSNLNKILSFYPDQIVPKLNVTTNQKKKIIKSLRLFGNKMREMFGDQLDNHRRQNHMSPLLEVIDVLPKDELAAMAESLVNLTCLKRKMSLGVETVGGPIDVAVISKGEGLIWIKRKHYFKKELNPQFFMRYNE